MQVAKRNADTFGNGIILRLINLSILLLLMVRPLWLSSLWQNAWVMKPHRAHVTNVNLTRMSMISMFKMIRTYVHFWFELVSCSLLNSQVSILRIFIWDSKVAWHINLDMFRHIIWTCKKKLDNMIKILVPTSKNWLRTPKMFRHIIWACKKSENVNFYNWDSCSNFQELIAYSKNN